MDFQRLEVLEDKIKKLVSSVKTLQTENDLLNSKKQESDRQIAKLKQELERHSQSADESSSLQEQIQALKKERDQIKTRVERLISFVEELEAKLV